MPEPGNSPMRSESEMLGQGQMRLWGKYSFRIRTAVILTLFILLTALGVGLAFRTLVSYLLDNRTDIELREEADEFVAQLESMHGPISEAQAKTWNRHAVTHELHHWFLRVFGPNKELVWESISAPEQTSKTAEGGDEIDSLESDSKFRTVQRPYYGPNSQRSGAPSGWLQVGCSLELQNGALAQLDRLLLWIFLAVSVLGPLASLALSAHLLNPLTEMTNQAAKLVVENSSQMLGRRGSGDELDSFANTVNSLLERVRSQLKAKEDWIANSAHQLRSPLAAITTNVEVVLSRLPEGKSSEMLSSVLNECEYLNKLVHQLLLLSETNAFGVKVRRQPIVWSDMVREACDFFEPLASSKEISMEYSNLQPITVFANRERLRIVLHNLIDNAIKYTHAGGSICVELTPTDQDRCLFTIQDTGIGIKTDDLHRVTQRFFRSDSGRDPATTPRGTGLGMSIVQAIVDGLDGELKIDSELGKGTTVSIQLPIIKASS